MILGDVEETVTTVEIDEETYEELYKVGEASSCCVAARVCVVLTPALCISVHKEEHPHAVCARGRRRPRGSAPPRGLAASRRGILQHLLWGSRRESRLLFCVKGISDTVGNDFSPA